MRNYFLFFLMMSLSSLVFAQQNISGKVFDTEGNAVELAGVLLFNENDTLKLLQGTATDSLGRFKFSNINQGRFLLKIQFVGFKPQNLLIEKQAAQNLILEKIILESDAQLLQAIEVVGQKEILQQTSKGFVMNADNMLAQQGGTVIDLLRNTPTIFVDAEGSLLLRGKTPLILVNGRNSKLTNLANIPASSIEKIEIITNPSAEYDAEAENGIINIVFKKGSQQGLNGAFAVGAGYGARGRLNGSALLNYKKGKWNLGFAYDNRLAERTRRVNGDRENFTLPSQYFITQRRTDNRDEESHNLRLNLDFENERNIFNLELIQSIEDEANFETLFSTFETQNREFTAKNRRFSEELSQGAATELALSYERKMKKEDQKMIFTLTSSFDYSTENTNINTLNLSADDQTIGTPFFQRTGFKDNSNVSNVRWDYGQKIGKGTFETGYKAILRFFDNEFIQEDQIDGEFQPVGERTGVFDFNEQVHALYAQYKNEINSQWDYEVGLRGEQTFNQGKVESLAIQFDNRYFNLFPSLNVGHHLSENQTLRFLYAKRINRPRLGQLEPFTDITDSLTQRSGNPNLQPEITDNFEIAYTNAFDKAAFTAKLYYRNGKNTILSFTVLQENGVLFTQPENVGRSETLGFEGIFSYSPVSAWQGNLSFSVFQQRIDAENIQTEVVNEVISWNVKWINDFNLWKNAKLQAVGVYNSPTATVQGTRIAVYNVDLAFQQKIWKDKARLGLIVTDIFDTQQNGFIWNTPEFNFSRVFKVDTRAFLLTFAYTFGTKFKEKLMENQFSNE